MLVEHLFNSLTPEQREEMLVFILKEEYNIYSKFEDKESFYMRMAIAKVLEHSMLDSEYDSWNDKLVQQMENKE